MLTPLCHFCTGVANLENSEPGFVPRLSAVPEAPGQLAAALNASTIDRLCRDEDRGCTGIIVGLCIVSLITFFLGLTVGKRMGAVHAADEREKYEVIECTFHTAPSVALAHFLFFLYAD